MVMIEGPAVDARERTVELRLAVVLERTVPERETDAPVAVVVAVCMRPEVVLFRVGVPAAAEAGRARGVVLPALVRLADADE